MTTDQNPTTETEENRIRRIVRQEMRNNLVPRMRRIAREEIIATLADMFDHAPSGSEVEAVVKAARTLADQRRKAEMTTQGSRLADDQR